MRTIGQIDEFLLPEIPYNPVVIILFAGAERGDVTLFPEFTPLTQIAFLSRNVTARAGQTDRIRKTGL